MSGGVPVPPHKVRGQVPECVSACDLCSHEDGYPRADSPGLSRSANGATDLDLNDSFLRYLPQRASPSRAAELMARTFVARAQPAASQRA